MIIRHPLPTIILYLLTISKSTAFIAPYQNIHHKPTIFFEPTTKTKTTTTPTSHPATSSTPRYTHLHSSKNNKDDDDDDDEIDLSDQDWRAFRAKLVLDDPLTESSSASSNNEDDDVDGIGAVTGGTLFSTYSEIMNQWAYDSGGIIEEGAVILGGVDQDFGFGLRQQYFHKVVILVLEHEETKFTKGIILNRPTDIVFDDGNEWRVWFGGDVQGLDSLAPDIVCLHSLNDESAREVSTTVMKDIQSCSFVTAQELVKKGVAKSSDFWVFCGYAGWGPGQLASELERKSWYMLATDSQTLLKELARQGLTVDPRDAGLDTWEKLMCMVGKSDRVAETKNNFDDLMLKEWARQLCTQYCDFEGRKKVPGLGGNIGAYFVAKSVMPLEDVVGVPVRDVEPGTLLRASPAIRSPFLLSKQELHKSLVLVLSDDDSLTVGVILNQPAAKGLDLEIVDKITRKRSVKTIPLRYGGEYAIKGLSPLLWLHCSDILKKAKIGSPINEKFSESNGPWKCTSDEATTAIGQGLASYHDFMVISGVSAWVKSENQSLGLKEDIRKGHFQFVDAKKSNQIWKILQKQELLSDSNLMDNLKTGYDAWLASSADDAFMDNDDTVDESQIMDGIGEGYDEENEALVFGSDVEVAKLSDNALRSWVATFLLGSPGLY